MGDGEGVYYGCDEDVERDHYLGAGVIPHFMHDPLIDS